LLDDDWSLGKRLYRSEADAILALVRAREDQLVAEVERLREANSILEDALQEVGDDYPGSSCQEWCQQQVRAARHALGDTHD
jgi:cell division septum initiation protein DivIVA